jgi:hypothetical protein
VLLPTDLIGREHTFFAKLALDSTVGFGLDTVMTTEVFDPVHAFAF